MHDRFLSLRYKGVKTPWEILRNASSFAWSCRKWARHQSHDDKVVLKAIADELITAGTLRAKDLPTLNRISEHVQRWRKDPDNFSLPPDERSEYQDLKRYIVIAVKNPAAMKKVIEEEFAISVPLSADVNSLPNAFKLFAFTRFVGILKGQPISTTGDWLELLQGAENALTEFCRDYCFDESDVSFMEGIPQSLIDLVLQEIDVPYAICVPSSAPSCEELDSDRVVLEQIVDIENLLCRLEYKKGKVYVRINERHPASQCGEVIDSRWEALMYALGEAYVSQLGDREAIDGFLRQLGLNLSRRLAH